MIEAQLAHGKSGPLGAAYDRAEFLDQRRTMMTTWANYLEELRDRPATATRKGEQPDFGPETRTGEPGSAKMARRTVPRVVAIDAKGMGSRVRESKRKPSGKTTVAPS